MHNLFLFYFLVHSIRSNRRGTMHFNLNFSIFRTTWLRLIKPKECSQQICQVIILKDRFVLIIAPDACGSLQKIIVFILFLKNHEYWLEWFRTLLVILLTSCLTLPQVINVFHALFISGIFGATLSFLSVGLGKYSVCTVVFF